MRRLTIRRDFAALEMRRRAGVALLKKGAAPIEVARKLGVSRQAVHDWWTAYQQGGLRALWHRKTPGRPRTLTTVQRKDLLKLLSKGALNYGFPTDLWTLKRIAQLIRQEFGIAFHRSHVHRIMVAEDWSCQVPKLQARERNQRKIRRWIRTTWHDAKKKAQALRATMVFVDESGFSLTPYRGRTWAPRGKTPILRHCCNWPKLSAISGVTPARKVYLQLVKGTIKTPQVICFVRHLLHHIRGPICLFWDNNSPHKSKLTQETLAGFAPRLSVYRLPPYAPELNPDEGVWLHLKCRALKGYCPLDLNQLINKIHRETKNLRRRPALIQSFFDETPLSF